MDHTDREQFGNIMFSQGMILWQSENSYSNQLVSKLLFRYVCQHKSLEALEQTSSIFLLRIIMIPF